MLRVRDGVDVGELSGGLADGAQILGASIFGTSRSRLMSTT